MRTLYGLIIATVLVISQSHGAIAGGSESAATDATQSQSTNPQTSSTGTNSETAVNASTSVNQQGVFQFNNSGLNNLTYPNCGGACVFAIGRTVQTSYGSHQWEAVAGLVWQFRSPENTQAESQKMIAEAQSENLTQESNVSLAEKLSEAIESGKRERANLLAILLSKRLGYANHQKLLQEMGVKF